MTIAILAMMFFAEPLSNFIHEHPSLKMLALAFLVLIGVLLISDGFGEEINRSYVYFAILFSLESRRSTSGVRQTWSGRRPRWARPGCRVEAIERRAEPSCVVGCYLFLIFTQRVACRAMPGP
jgi:hypothetical protein